ncbi:MAG TPA: CheR family methyltransferase [Actinomycetota bacterium]|nr:CheR family methyltransferase [Actinomycetota bacterium]
MEESVDPELELLLSHIRATRGFDFGEYKPASLTRRINRRMQALGIDSYSQYLDRLQVNPSEYEQLFNFILINVTSFFRDPEVWDYLREEAIPRALERKMPSDPIRVWCAGCASGEEAYSVVMVLAELLGPQAVTERVKVYGTDVDSEALTLARAAVYTARQVESVPPQLLKSYFEESNGKYAFDRELRRSVIFGRHDLLQDAPISHVDILTCRNTLMYFNSEAQGRIMSRFYFGLNDDGILVLGRAEMMSGYGKAFVPLDLKRRVFSRGPKREARDRLMLLAQAGDQEALGQLTNHVRAPEMVFEGASVAQIMVDSTGLLVLANARAREIFGLQPADVGRPFQDLELSWRPARLQQLMEQAQREEKKVSISGVEWQALGEHMYLDIDIVPLHDNGSRVLGFGVHFFDVSRERSLRHELEQSNQELETAIEEIQSTNEELETTNEELQSTNEELETTNEELQATNEELETMNQELQSTNEELQATNEELRSRTKELNLLNQFLEKMMASVHASVIVLDSGLKVKLWNRHSQELWGLREDEVLGAPLLSLDAGLPVDVLAPAMAASLRGSADYYETELDAVDRRGRSIRCRASVTPMKLESDESSGVVLMLEKVVPPHEPDQ